MRADKKWLVTILVTVWANTSHAGLISTYFATGESAADIQGTVDEFRVALGENNGNLPENGDPNGRRQINWDGLPDSLSDPNLFPGDFFNGSTPGRARGIEFQETGDTTGFLVSSTEASGQPTAFGFENFLPTFSEERLFAPVGGTTFDILFFDPSDQITQATTKGMGIVFSGLDFDDTVQVDFLNLAGELLASLNPLGPADSDLSFLGAIFDTAEVAKVQIAGGNRFLIENGSFGGGIGDGFAMDDFIFGEPIPVSQVEVSAPSSMALLFAGLGICIALRRR
jgi:hypothetical protein